MTTARGTFEVDLTPETAELQGVVGRFALRKTWHGDLSGNGVGLMLTAGDPTSGTAGYVAIETFEGLLADQAGGFAFQQFGTMIAGAPTLHYAVVPGSGTGELHGLTGTLALTVEADGAHVYELDYAL